MSSHDFPQRKSLLALLTVAGGLVAVMPALTIPAFAQTLPQGAPDARSTKAVIPCITSPKTRNSVQPCVTNPKSKATAPVSTATNPKAVDGGITKPNPKTGNWDMKNPKTGNGDLKQ